MADGSEPGPKGLVYSVCGWTALGVRLVTDNKGAWQHGRDKEPHRRNAKGKEMREMRSVHLFSFELGKTA